MNIKLYVAARDNVQDLSISAKAALLDVISRCAQTEETAAVSVATVAADTGAHWTTAQRALFECQTAKYLYVEKPADKSAPTRWKVLTSQIATSHSARSTPSQFARRARAPRAPNGLKEGLKEGSAAARSPSRASAAAVEKNPPEVAPAPPHDAAELVERLGELRKAQEAVIGPSTRPAANGAVAPRVRDELERHGDDCRCLGTGWVTLGDDGAVERCPGGLRPVQGTAKPARPRPPRRSKDKR